MCLCAPEHQSSHKLAQIIYVVTDIELDHMMPSPEAQYQQNKWAAGLQCFKYGFDAKKLQLLKNGYFTHMVFAEYYDYEY